MVRDIPRAELEMFLWGNCVYLERSNGPYSKDSG